MSAKLQVIPPALGVDVAFWGIDLSRDDVQRDEGDKVKDCQFHPGVKPWILCSDRGDHVILWDYGKKSCVFKRALTDICSAPEIQLHGFVGDSPGLQAERETECFLQKRIPTRDVTATCGNLPSYLSSLNSNAHTQRMCDDYFRRQAFPAYLEKQSLQSTRSTSHPHSHHMSGTAGPPGKGSQSLLATIRANPGEVRSLHFIDSESVTFGSSDSLTSSSAASATATFHSGSRVMIVTDNAVIFYDFLAHRSKIIVFGDVKPMSADFVFFDLLAIGCTDGSIKIWDCAHWKEVKSLSHPTKEVVVVKAVQILQ
jgi:WD40 repeat protein